ECLFHAILVVDLHLPVSVWVAIKSNRSIVVVLIVVELREIDSALFHRVDGVVGQDMTGLEMLSEREPNGSALGRASSDHRYASMSRLMELRDRAMAPAMCSDCWRRGISGITVTASQRRVATESGQLAPVLASPLIGEGF